LCVDFDVVITPHYIYADFSDIESDENVYELAYKIDDSLEFTGEKIVDRGHIQMSVSFLQKGQGTINHPYQRNNAHFFAPSKRVIKKVSRKNTESRG
jgi:hypothetical protein